MKTYSIFLEVLYKDEYAESVFNNVVSGSRAGLAFHGSLKQVFTKYFKDNIDDVKILDTTTLFRIGSDYVEVPTLKMVYFNRFCMTLRNLCSVFKNDGLKFTLEVVEVGKREHVTKNN